MSEKWGKCLFRVFLVIIKAVSIFSSLGHGPWGQHLFLVCVSVYPHHLPITKVYVFTLRLQCPCFHRNPLRLSDLENLHVDLPTDLLNHLKNDLFVMPNLFMFLLNRNDLVSLSQLSQLFSVFPTLKNAMRKLFPTIVITEVNYCNSELQLPVPGLFLL